MFRSANVARIRDDTIAIEDVYENLSIQDFDATSFYRGTALVAHAANNKYGTGRRFSCT